MREKLAQIEGKRCAFVGRFSRFGEKRGWQGRRLITVVLQDIRDMHASTSNANTL